MIVSWRSYLLHIYILMLTSSRCLQIPEHYIDEAPPVAVKAPQKLLRQSIVGIFPTGDTQPEMYPRYLLTLLQVGVLFHEVFFIRHILGNILGPGLTIIKHGMSEQS